MEVTKRLVRAVVGALLVLVLLPIAINFIAPSIQGSKNETLVGIVVWVAAALMAVREFRRNPVRVSGE